MKKIAAHAANVGLLLQLVAWLAQLGLRVSGSTLVLDPVYLYGGLVLFSSAYLVRSLGTRSGSVFFWIVFTVTSLAELFAQTYGLFGVRYRYSPAHWPGFLFEMLPVLVPCMWVAGMVPSYWIAGRLTPPLLERAGVKSRFVRALALAFVGGCLMTWWDLLLDPLSVGLGLWSWEGGPYPYFGVPSENIASWLIGTVGTQLILRWVLPQTTGSADRSPEIAYALLGALYLTTLTHPLLLTLAAGMVMISLVSLWVSSDETAEFRFVTRWKFDATREEIASILMEAQKLPEWWPSVYLKVTDSSPRPPERPEDYVITLDTKGWLPYTLRWNFRLERNFLPEGFSLVAWGDFEGRGVWNFHPEGPGTEVVYEWTVWARKPILRRFSFLLRPLFLANHSWAMKQGETSLRLELERRRAKTGEEKARVPAPPKPTFLSFALRDLERKNPDEPRSRSAPART